MKIIILLLLIWIFPSFLAIRGIYKQLPKDSTIQDLFNFCYGCGWLSLFPIGNIVIWVETLPDISDCPKFITNFLNKKIK